jgi:glycosyltransferase involved in cell wall biosynthesis
MPSTLGGARERFGIPAKFVLVCNQLWRHKNHRVVIEATALLKREGLQIPVVIVGLPLDNRDPSNSTVSEVLQLVAVNGLSSQILVLGQVDRGALIDLMRAAAVVLQPSLFEGWSTVVQDALAIGRPLLCSDIPVHREQAGDRGGFFCPDQPAALASSLRAMWAEVAPGPDLSAEERCLARERQFVRLHGQGLIGLCEEAVAAVRGTA